MLAAYLDRGRQLRRHRELLHERPRRGDPRRLASPRARDGGEHVVLASKFFGNMFPGDPNGGGAGRGSIVAQLEATLRRLRTDYLDLYWLHHWDRSTPIDETMRTLDDLVRAGKIRYLGFSNTPAWLTAQAHTTALLRGWTPLDRAAGRVLAAGADGRGRAGAASRRDAGLALVPWSPLKNGFLSGKFRRERRHRQQPDAVRREAGRRRSSTSSTSSPRSRPSSASTAAAVSLAWLRSRPGTVVPIVGPRRVDQLRDNLSGLDVDPHPGPAAPPRRGLGAGPGLPRAAARRRPPDAPVRRDDGGRRGVDGLPAPAAERRALLDAPTCARRPRPRRRRSCAGCRRGSGGARSSGPSRSRAGPG